MSTKQTIVILVFVTLWVAMICTSLDLFGYLTH